MEQKIFINPGSGSVAASSEQEARRNIATFANDVRREAGCDRLECVRDHASDADDGRYAWVLSSGNQAVEIQMPGVALDTVRYTGEEGQNIWAYPRVLVNGSSWVWLFAVHSAADVLSGISSEE